MEKEEFVEVMEDLGMIQRPKPDCHTCVHLASARDIYAILSGIHFKFNGVKAFGRAIEFFYDQTLLFSVVNTAIYAVDITRDGHYPTCHIYHTPSDGFKNLTPNDILEYFVVSS